MKTKELTEQQIKDSRKDYSYNLDDFPECRYRKHTISWFDECFRDCGASYLAKVASMRIVVKFGISGICDPAYIANVIDYDEEINREPKTRQSVTKRLVSCYSTCIEKTGLTKKQAEEFIYNSLGFIPLGGV